jgi:hypothetical protein
VLHRSLLENSFHEVVANNKRRYDLEDLEAYATDEKINKYDQTLDEVKLNSVSLAFNLIVE